MYPLSSSFMKNKDIQEMNIIPKSHIINKIIHNIIFKSIEQWNLTFDM